MSVAVEGKPRSVRPFVTDSPEHGAAVEFVEATQGVNEDRGDGACGFRRLGVGVVGIISLQVWGAGGAGIGGAWLPARGGAKDGATTSWSA